MDELNPYSPPQSDPVLVPGDEAPLPLASRWLRLVASIVDWLIVTAILFPIQWVAGSLDRSVSSAGGTTMVHFRMADNWKWTLIGVAVWAVVNWVFLQNGQTIGKKLLKLQIQRKSGAKAEPMRLLLHRQLIINLLIMAPYIGWLIGILDVLMIFREERNTLHDDIADTKVVQLRS